jgi:hypothetical protein
VADLVKRLRYFNGQFLREPDFTAEQDYHLQHQRDHTRLLHNPGIAQGLDIQPPPAGATGVTVNAGIAFDDQGRRLLLSDNKPLDFAGLPDNQVVFVTITYRETESDPTDESGATGDTNTRLTENPSVDPATAMPANPKGTLVLARIERTGKVVSRVDTSMRLVAGAKAGDVEVFSLTFKSDAIAPAGWVKTQLDPQGGALTVAGNLKVTGTISGDIALGTVKPGDLANDAVVSVNLAKADGSSGQDTSSGSGVKTGHIQNGAVTNVKIGADLDGRIKTGETHAAIITGNPHNTTAKDIDGANNQIVAQINAGAGIINTARLAVPEKLNGKFVNGQVTLPQPNPLLLINHDLRGKLITIRGWISSATDATPSFLAAATQVKTWAPPVPAVQEAWVFCKGAATSPATTSLFTITDPATNKPIAFVLQFTNAALNLVMTGDPITFGYVFQITWQE